jgi:DNA-binding GntR family transcriptional regulator
MGFFEADEEFHALMLEFTGFPKVAAAAGTLSLQIKRARILLLPEEGRAAETVAEHAAILDTVRKGDPDAARAAMSFHLGQLISRIEPLERRHPEFFRPR